MDVVIGVVDVKSYYIEMVEDIVECVCKCLEFVFFECFLFVFDCGFS